MMGDKLVTWVENKLVDRNWSIREFGRQVGISHTHAARIVNGESRPSISLCHDIADVFDVPRQEVMRIAGLLPPVPEMDADLEEALYLFEQLPDTERHLILVQLRALAKLENNEERPGHRRPSLVTGVS